MGDVHSKEIRSYNMSRIRSENTKPEMIVRKALHAAGFRFRLYDRALPGKPDIVLKNHRTVVFINGCFWHGHEKCKFFKMPATRTEWWTEKIARTKERDAAGVEELTKLGWNVIVIFECELKNDYVKETIINLTEEIKVNTDTRYKNTFNKLHEIQ